MAEEGLGGPLGVARGAGLEQLLVDLLVAVLERALLCEERRALALAALPGRPDQPHEPS